MSVQRYSAEEPCPICSGHEKMPSGQGIRCYGFVADDGWAMCTREGEGTKAKYHSNSNGWSHRIEGACPCGTVHRDSQEWLRKQNQSRTDNHEMTRERPTDERGGRVHSIGESKNAKIVTTYDYLHLDGRLLYQVCRMEPKSFRQRRKHPETGEWVWKMKAHGDLPEQATTLYQIPELFAALSAGDDVWICEGEKDVEAFRSRQLVATCNTGGAGKWRPEFVHPFIQMQAGGEIIIVQDRDDAGEKHARQIFDSLRDAVPEAIHIRIVEPVEGKDASDHFDSGHGPNQFALVWPVSEEMLKTAPAIFKRNILRQALVMPEAALQVAGGEEIAEDPPRFRSPLKGDKQLGHLQGVVTIAGAPSSGKSYFAIACGIDNALDEKEPWEVFYLNCEMHRDYVIDRALRSSASYSLTHHACQQDAYRQEAVRLAQESSIPSRFVRVDINLGVTMEEVIEFLSDNVGDIPTLVILDSISSFTDSMDEISGDSFGMSNLRSVQKYATAVRRLTKGHVSWIILSELNKEGRAKGRSLDHRSDLAMSMSPDPDRGWIKNLKVTKSWFGPTGALGEFILFPEIARLVKVESDV